MSWCRQQQQKGADQFKKSMKGERQTRLAANAKRAKYSMNQPFDGGDFNDEMDYKRSRLENDETE